MGTASGGRRDHDDFVVGAPSRRSTGIVMQCVLGARWTGLAVQGARSVADSLTDVRSPTYPTEEIIRFHLARRGIGDAWVDMMGYESAVI